MVFPNWFFSSSSFRYGIKEVYNWNWHQQKEEKEFHGENTFLIVATAVLPTMSPCKATWNNTLKEKSCEELRFKGLV